MHRRVSSSPMIWNIFRLVTDGVNTNRKILKHLRFGYPILNTSRSLLVVLSTFVKKPLVKRRRKKTVKLRALFSGTVGKSVDRPRRMGLLQQVLKIGTRRQRQRVQPSSELLATSLMLGSLMILLLSQK